MSANGEKSAKIFYGIFSLVIFGLSIVFWGLATCWGFFKDKCPSPVYDDLNDGGKFASFFTQYNYIKTSDAPNSHNIILASDQFVNTAVQNAGVSNYGTNRQWYQYNPDLDSVNYIEVDSTEQCLNICQELEACNGATVHGGEYIETTKDGVTTYKPNDCEGSPIPQRCQLLRGWPNKWINTYGPPVIVTPDCGPDPTASPWPDDVKVVGESGAERCFNYKTFYKNTYITSGEITLTDSICDTFPIPSTVPEESTMQVSPSPTATVSPTT